MLIYIILNRIMNIFPYSFLVFLYSCSAAIFSFYFYLCNLEGQIYKPKLHDNFLVYDFIVVGAGSAGSVVARRLAEDAGHTVLLLEAGGTPGSLMDIPVLAPLLQLSRFDWQYKTEPQEYSCFGLNDKRSQWPRGKVLGGSSRLNYMMYLRGDPKDFDGWEQSGNPGWKYKDTLPYFKRAEKQYGSYKQDGVNHGTNGLLGVSDVPWTSGLATAFIEAGRVLGYDEGDLNSDLNSGFMVTQLTAKNGKRQSCDAAYLDQRPNLHVLTYAQVEKVLFRRRNEAFGIQFKHHTENKIAMATKEIILSSGAIGSPHLLLLSGVGPSEQLLQHEIPIIANLQGVGKNLVDHLTTGADIALLDPPASDMATMLSTLASPLSVWDFVWSSSGPLTSAGVDAFALVHSPLVNKTTDPPDLQIMFMPLGFSTDCGKMYRYAVGTSNKVWDDYFGLLCGQAVASFIPVLLRPHSHGELRLRSSNPRDYPLIDPRYLSNHKDVETMVQGMRFIEKLLSSAPLAKLGARLNSNPMPGCEELLFASDEYWECYVRHLSLTTYHPAGTCRMGPAARADSVVDPQLRVHGVGKLRVIDASIMPSIVGANINAATIMIAEKGADMIRTFWRHQKTSCSLTDVFLNAYQSPATAA